MSNEDFDTEEDGEFHIPNGVLMEMDGQTQIRLITYLTVDTPDQMQEHILSILDAHLDNWLKTPFSGDVNFQCWNDILEPEHMEPVGDVLGQILGHMQGVIDSNDFKTADGNRLVLRASLSKHANEATMDP